MNKWEKRGGKGEGDERGGGEVGRCGREKEGEMSQEGEEGEKRKEDWACPMMLKSPGFKTRISLWCSNQPTRTGGYTSVSD